MQSLTAFAARLLGASSKSRSPTPQTTTQLAADMSPTDVDTALPDGSADYETAQRPRKLKPRPANTRRPRQQTKQHNHQQQPGSAGPSSGAGGHSPLAEAPHSTQQQRQAQPTSSQRQLYAEGFCEDREATATREKVQRAKGVLLDRPPVPPLKAEEHQQLTSEQLRGSRQPTEADILQLTAEFERDPGLLQRLTNAEGSSSSSPQHLWQLRVFAAFQRQQSELLQQHQEIVIADSEGDDDDDEAEEEEDPAPQPSTKRRRNMPPPVAAVGAAGSSRPAKRPRQQQQQPEAMELDGDDDSDSHQQEQQQRAAAKPRAPARRQQQQPAQPPTARRAAPAAAGGGRSSSNVSDKELKRLLRADLRQLEAAAANQHDSNVDPSSARLVDMLLQADRLGHKADKPREAAQHAGLLATLASDAAAMLTSYRTGSRGRQPANLIGALRAKAARDPAAAAMAPADAPVALDWAKVGCQAAHLFRTAAAPGVMSMSGALAGAAKVRARGVRQRRQALEPEQRPVVGAAALRQDHGLGQETERVVTDMRRALEAAPGQQASVLRLVLDHDSFAHTVENVFALSFLCKDMYVELRADDEEGLQVIHVSKERRHSLIREAEAAATAAAAGGGGGGGSTSSRAGPHLFMMQMDMALWRAMCSIVERGDTLMPQRPCLRH